MAAVTTANPRRTTTTEVGCAAIMARPCKRRHCRAFAGDRVFKPRSVPMCELEAIRLDLAELEAMRLCDLEGLTQEDAGLRMRVSRGTVQRLVSRGRAKVVRALLQTAALVIEAAP